MGNNDVTEEDIIYVSLPMGDATIDEQRAFGNKIWQ